MQEQIDQVYMRQALELAKLGGRAVAPNPLVGAVIVNNKEVIGTGYHQQLGQPHAEVNAIKSVSDYSLLHSSTLYVNLEPCSHTGRTPPCADLIIKSSIPRVVIGTRDPFPLVAGQGIAKLRAAGIEVVENVLYQECLEVNKRFITAHRYKRPYIILKWAQSADGFIAPLDRSRLTFSSPESLALLHYWRGQEMAIAVGLNTAINDNPSLTVRDTSLFRSSELPARQPVRIVIGDSTKLAAQLSETSNTPTPPKRLKILTPEAPTVITIPQTSANSTEQSLMINTSHNGADRAEFKDGLNELYYDPSQALLPQLLSELYQRQITSLIIEGGADTLTRAIEAGLWDEARVITAPIRLKVGIPAPKLNLAPSHHESVGADTIEYFTNAVATSLSSANPHP